MIAIKDFTIGFKERALLEKVYTQFRGNTLTAIIGRNGAGKSTFLKALAGLNDKYEGEIIVNDEILRKLPRGRLSKLIAYVNTQRPRLANLKCRDIVTLGRSPYTSWHGRLTREDEGKVEESLKMVGMEDYADRYFNSLSDGEAQKIMIARAIAQDTPVMILDEPTSFLDFPMRKELAQLLRFLSQEKGKTVIYSTHEIDIAMKYSDFVALFHDKKIINEAAEEMKRNPVLKELFY